MDLERLQIKAIDAIKTSDGAFQRKLREEKARLEALEQLKAAREAREAALLRIASIAIEWTSGSARNEIEPESIPIVVGRAEVVLPSGGSVERNLVAVVTSQYDSRLKSEERTNLPSLAPEAVRITYSVQAESGDQEKGVMADVKPIGAEPGEDEPKVVYGQLLESERFSFSEVPGGGRNGSESSRVYTGDHIPEEMATRIKAQIEAQIPQITSTLDLLQNALQPVAAQ